MSSAPVSTFREGLEAAVTLSIVLAFLSRSLPSDRVCRVPNDTRVRRVRFGPLGRDRADDFADSFVLGAGDICGERH
jgi:hypothetical protein